MVLNMIDPQPGYPHNTMPSTSPATITKNGGKGKGSEEIAAPPVKMNGASFADLPDECLERVFGFLELADVLALGRVNQLFSSLFHSTKVQLNLHLTTSGLLSNPSVTFPAAPVESGIVPVIQHGRKSLLSSASTSSTITSAPITPGTSFNTASNPTRSSALSTLNDLHQKNKSWSRLEPRRVESEGVSVVGRSQIYELQCGLFVWAEGYSRRTSPGRVFPNSLRFVPLPVVRDGDVRASERGKMIEQGEMNGLTGTSGAQERGMELGSTSGAGLGKRKERDEDEERTAEGEDTDGWETVPRAETPQNVTNGIVPPGILHRPIADTSNVDEERGGEMRGDGSEERELRQVMFAPASIQGSSAVGSVESAPAGTQPQTSTSTISTSTRIQSSSAAPSSSTSAAKPATSKSTPVPPKQEDSTSLLPSQSYATDLPLGARDVGFWIADLTLDPTQGLVVVSEYLEPQASLPNTTAEVELNAYHLLTISDLKPHPAAKSPVLRWPVPAPTATSTGQLLQIMGDVLAVLVIAWDGTAGDPIHQAVRVWNWRTGVVLSDHALPYASCAASFALLSPTEYLITTVASHAALDDMTPTIQVYQFNHADVNDTHAYIDRQPRLLAGFMFPALGPNVLIDGVDVRPDPPFPSLRRGEREPSGLYNPRPYVEDYRKGVFVFAVQALHQPDENAEPGNLEDWSDLLLFVKKETLLEMAKLKDEECEGMVPSEMSDIGFADMLMDEETATAKLKLYEWKDWGPENSRLIHNESTTSRQWVCCISGYRYVTSVRHRLAEHSTPGPDTYIPARQGPHWVRMYDFNPYSISKFISDHNDGDAMDIDSPSSVTLHTESLTIRKKRIFVEDVVTSLPYLEIQTKETYAFDGLMMDESRVMLIKCFDSSREGIEQRFETWAM